MSHLLCFGLGYSGLAVARRLSARGWRLSGTSRSEDGVRRLKAEGIDGVLFCGLPAAHAERLALASVTHVLVSVPPDGQGDPVLRCLGTALAAHRELQWLGYLSTVGVYGDAKGGWVDETTPIAPLSPRAQSRARAEEAWLDFGRHFNRHVEIFRLSGIYGPGRSAIDDLKAGTARRIVKPGQVFNRIHVEDIARAVAAAIDRPNAGAIYNVTDDEPAPPQDVVAYAARLLGLPPPPKVPFAEAVLSEMGRSFYAECKRVRNDLAKRALGLSLLYPTYREGLSAILAAPRRSDVGR